MIEKLAKLGITGTVIVAVDVLFGLPIAGSAIVSLLTQSTCDAVLPKLQAQFLKNGIANHDIQKAMI